MMSSSYRRGLVCLLALCLAGSLLAEQPRPASSKSFAWRLKKAENTVYLLGSVHLLKDKDYPLPGVFDKAYRDSAVIVMEIDPRDLSSPDTGRLTMKIARLPKNQYLFQKLPKTTYDKTKAVIEKMGGNMSALEPFKPWFIAVTITAARLQALGYKQENGIEVYFTRKAARDKKETRGLETVEFQLGLFDKLSESDQVAFLQQSLDDLGDVEKQADKMITAWRNGVTCSLESIIFKNLKNYPGVHKRLFIERNKSWVPKIEAFLNEKKNVVVVVGAGHLVGKLGVVRLLQLKGYRATQL